MLRRALLASLLATPIGSAVGAREVRDAIGRTAEVGERIARVFPAGPPASVLLYTIAPDLMAGWPGRVPTPADAAFLLDEAARLPEIGRLTGRDNSANIEAMLRNRPDLVLDYGSINATYVSLANRVQQQTGVPTLLLDGALAKIPETYRQLGDILGRRVDGEERARAAETILAEAATHAATLASRGRPKVLYVRGPRGLETGLAGSINTEIIEFAGAENVAGRALGSGGITQISLEQMAAWNPDWIIATQAPFVASARQDPVWSTLAAVREGRIVVTPGVPFGWLDIPPSVNRLIGLIWLPVLFGASCPSTASRSA
jgi:iron complex transport system substrate-binding protein